MATRIEIKRKPPNPNTNTGVFAAGQIADPVEPPKGRFQRGVDMISNYFSNLGDKRANLAAAAAAESDKGTPFFENPYYMDFPRFIGNQAAGAGEFFLDLAQILPEAGGQMLGYDVGSGRGSGDIGYMINRLIDPDAADIESMALSNVYSTAAPFDDFNALVADERFQNYLRGEGFNVPTEFDFYTNIMDYGSEASQQNFLDNIAMDESSPFFVGEAPSIYDFDAEGGMEPYNQAVQEYSNKLIDSYDQYMADEATKLLSETLVPSFAETQFPGMIEQLSNELNITPQSAESMLMGGGVSNFGLLNDLFDFYYPFEYQTKEGQEFFGDPGVDVVGSLPAFGGISSLIRGGGKGVSKVAPRTYNALLKQMYPGTFGGRLDIPVRFGKDGARMDMGILLNYPKTSKGLRVGGQSALTLGLPNVIGDGE